MARIVKWLRRVWTCVCLWRDWFMCCWLALFKNASSVLWCVFQRVNKINLFMTQKIAHCICPNSYRPSLPIWNWPIRYSWVKLEQLRKQVNSAVRSIPSRVINPQKERELGKNIYIIYHIFSISTSWRRKETQDNCQLEAKRFLFAMWHANWLNLQEKHILKGEIYRLKKTDLAVSKCSRVTWT